MKNDFDDFVIHYSNEELLTMVYQFDQWDNEMLAAIQNELLFRNLLPNDWEEKRNRIIAKEDSFLSEGREATFPQQFLGWIGVVGILGLIIGYELAFAKTISKYTGKEYLKYDENSRESGRYMFYLSLALIVGFILYKFMNFIERNY